MFSTEERRGLLIGLLILSLVKPKVLLTVCKWLTLVIIVLVLIRIIYLKRPVKKTMALIKELMGLISPVNDVTYPNLPGSPSERSDEEETKGLKQKFSQ
jgi:hypothetical protein